MAASSCAQWRPYPRRFSTDKIDIGQQPNPVDQFIKSASGSSKTDAAAQSSSEKNVRPVDLAQPATAIDAANPTGSGAPSSGAPLFPDVPSLVSGLNVLPPGADALFSIALSNGNINDAKYDDESNGEEHNQLDPAESFQDEAKTPDDDYARLQLPNRPSKPLTRVR